MATLIMCIGNLENGDDGVGPYIAQIFPNTDGYDVVDCETVPENYTHLIKHADQVVLIDAVDMNLPPGEMRIVSCEKIGGLHISTHSIPLSVLMRYIENQGKKVILVGIQPKRLHGEMSEEVKQAAQKLVRIIINHKIEDLEVLR